MERVDTVLEVSNKELPNGKTLYLLKDSNGTEYSTTIRELARIGHEAVASGQYVHLDYDEKQVERNGRTYTNHYLNAIKPIADEATSSGVQAVMDRAQEAQQNRILDETPKSLFDDAQPEPQGRISDYERQLLIVAQSSLKAAIETLPHLSTDQKITPVGITDVAEYYARWALQWRP